MNNKNYIYVVVTRTDTKIAKSIRFLSKKAYSHASISCDADLTRMYSFCRDKVDSPLPANFNHENLDTSIFGLFHNIPCEIYRVGVSEEQYQKFILTIDHFINNRDLYTYNVPGLFLSGLHIPHRFRYKFVCSVWVAFVLGKSGILLENKKHQSLVQPDDLRYIDNAELFYRGNLKDYPKFLEQLRRCENSEDNELRVIKNDSLKKSEVIATQQ